MIYIAKHIKIPRRLAQAIMRQHVGPAGFARYTYYTNEPMFDMTKENAQRCIIGEKTGVGEETIYGTGRSFREAFENAGVHFLPLEGRDHNNKTNGMVDVKLLSKVAVTNNPCPPINFQI